MPKVQQVNRCRLDEDLRINGMSDTYQGIKQRETGGIPEAVRENARRERQATALNRSSLNGEDGYRSGPILYP